MEPFFSVKILLARHNIVTIVVITKYFEERERDKKRNDMRVLKCDLFIVNLFVSLLHFFDIHY